MGRSGTWGGRRLAGEEAPSFTSEAGLAHAMRTMLYPMPTLPLVAPSSMMPGPDSKESEVKKMERYRSARLPPNGQGRLVRSRGLEPPRARPTAPSTLRVYQFRHDRNGTGF
jgi:hypothetical protein